MSSGMPTSRSCTVWKQASSPLAEHGLCTAEKCFSCVHFREGMEGLHLDLRDECFAHFTSWLAFQLLMLIMTD